MILEYNQLLYRLVLVDYTPLLPGLDLGLRPAAPGGFITTTLLPGLLLGGGLITTAAVVGSVFVAVADAGGSSSSSGSSSGSSSNPVPTTIIINLLVYTYTPGILTASITRNIIVSPNTNLIIPNSIDISNNGVTQTYNVTDISKQAFLNCTHLTNVTIGDSVLTIGISAFQSCTSLKNITIGN